MTIELMDIIMAFVLYAIILAIFGGTDEDEEEEFSFFEGESK